MPPQNPERQANPVLVTESRGGHPETHHRGAFAVSDASGRIVASAGDLGRKVFPRSAIKFIQALPLVESGAADRFALSDVELALAGASHGGEERHVAAVELWLKRIDCVESDLDCGPHLPSYEPAANALIRQGRAPCRLHNNCSGKHTGFLTLAKHIGAPFAGYDHLDHPVQLRIVEALSALSGFDAKDFAIGIDGCGAPNFALPLQNLATAFARIADPVALPKERREAIVRLSAAQRAEPFFIAGTGRLCTRVIEDGFNVIPKTGAEGVYVAALPGLKLGLALKIDDGARFAAQSLFVALLVKLGAVPANAPLARDYVTQAIGNTQGLTVGERRVDMDALDELFSRPPARA